jgi:hypothetical protein
MALGGSQLNSIRQSTYLHLKKEKNTEEFETYKQGLKVSKTKQH